MEQFNGHTEDGGEPRNFVKVAVMHPEWIETEIGEESREADSTVYPRHPRNETGQDFVFEKRDTKERGHVGIYAATGYATAGREARDLVRLREMVRVGWKSIVEITMSGDISLRSPPRSAETHSSAAARR